MQEPQLADTICVVRQRVMANRWLKVWLRSCNWIVVVLIVAVTVVRSMRGPLIAGVGLVALAALATAIGVWHQRPSAYEIAQRLDRAGHLSDRISTAVYFWAAKEPSELMLRQRGDALAHLAKVQPRAMFRVQLPEKMWWSAVLVGVLAALCAYHSVYGPPIPRLGARAAQSSALAAVLSPVTRTVQFAYAEKQELADLAAGKYRDRKATEAQKPSRLPAPGEPTSTAQETTNAVAHLDTAQALNEANTTTGNESQAANMSQSNADQQAADAPANSQAASATDQRGNQSTGNGQQSLGERALQALESLMKSAFSGQQNSPQAPPSALQANSTTATVMQATSGSSQTMRSPTNQAAQGQTSNSQGSQNQTRPNLGKQTGAGNGTSPWQPRTDKDPRLADNTVKEHVDLQTTGFRGGPGKDHADVAPGTAQIALQDIAPQTVTAVNGAGQDSVPSRYRRYVQDYFQHAEK